MEENLPLSNNDYIDSTIISRVNHYRKIAKETDADKSLLIKYETNFCDLKVMIVDRCKKMIDIENKINNSVSSFANQNFQSELDNYKKERNIILLQSDEIKIREENLKIKIEKNELFLKEEKAKYLTIFNFSKK